MFIEIISTAAVNAINPCALAVMLLVLISVLNAHPDNKKKVIYAGLAFTIAVFISYFIYGTLIMKFFSSILPSGLMSNYIFKGFGLLALVIGLLNIKDYLNYKPGSFATEMPLSFRPKMRNLVQKVTSARGAFVVGILVTFFLLPCTIAPYLIALRELSTRSFTLAIPWLLLYNFIFVLPMLVLTLVIYFGLSSVERVHEWRERKIQKIHLIAGIILILLGIAMVTGLI